jgi:hypothetical protein
MFLSSFLSGVGLWVRITLPLSVIIAALLQLSGQLSCQEKSLKPEKSRAADRFAIDMNN